MLGIILWDKTIASALWQFEEIEITGSKRAERKQSGNYIFIICFGFVGSQKRGA
jgi:hypothetical protein